MRSRWARLAAVLAVCTVVLTGCVPSAPATNSVPFSPSSLRYGVAPQQNAGTTFQPDVVIVGGGGAAVIGETADGLTWYLNPNAQNANQLAVGKIMFVTSRGVGRVIDLAHKDGTLAVTIAPVQITDVIKDGAFANTGPISMSRVIVQATPQAFWANPDVITAVGVSPDRYADARRTTIFRSASQQLPVDATPPITVPDLPRPRMPEPKIGNIAKVTSGGFAITGICCSAGVGTNFTYNKNGIEAVGSLALKIDNPQADFNLKVSDGKVAGAEFLLKGAASLHTRLKVGSEDGHPFSGTSQPLGADMDFTIPVGTILGVPFSVTVSQLFTIAITIPGSAELTGQGDYSLGGELGFKYDGHTLSSSTKGDFQTSQAINASSSIAVGISRAFLDYQVNFRLGIGAFGFTAGLDFGLAAHVTLSYGAPVGFNESDSSHPIEQCKTAQGALWAAYGVGYTMPKPLTKVINFFLKYFHTRPIDASGGKHTYPLLINTGDTYPHNGLCTKG